MFLKKEGGENKGPRQEKLAQYPTSGQHAQALKNYAEREEGQECDLHGRGDRPGGEEKKRKKNLTNPPPKRKKDTITLQCPVKKKTGNFVLSVFLEKRGKRRTRIQGKRQHEQTILNIARQGEQR